MAITGIREMSTLATPPEDRHPILTYVGPHENAQVAAAIRRELLRDGQVFYIHNRVSSIEKAAAKITAQATQAPTTSFLFMSLTESTERNGPPGAHRRAVEPVRFR